ncbi:uncharacterized protein B0H18DRAFT_663490 [Fomitopsis serialis]|uniref:uncharacterized protein n=1 Tax=Fomitopsis serialis TaxID=139415 RepID=UPI00200850EA|nr:uncharacterized protein B0H18DRAFT_663490 [Neoantrodia serialis]KAH9918666.1 hypothetical protein B0H18DRAFT_663490 [Neoantrodia serialis]
MIIDYLSQHDWSALLACTAVCQAWHVRAQLYLPQGDGHAVGLPSRREVILLSRFSRVRALRTKAVHVYGDPHSRSLAHFGTFAAMLSGKLRQLEELHIVDGIWKVAALNIIILCRRLPTFTAIHRLRLRNVTLPSTTAFAHFICALPGLRTLECVNVTVSTTPKQRYGDSAALRILRDPPFELKKLILDCPDGDAIVDLFAMAGLARKSRSVWLIRRQPATLTQPVNHHIPRLRPIPRRTSVIPLYCAATLREPQEPAHQDCASCYGSSRRSRNFVCHPVLNSWHGRQDVDYR